MVSKSESVIFDFDFMKKFSGILRKMIAQDSKFGIALGGGYMMRKLRDIAKEAGISEDLQLHWIGTTYNNVNAEIVRAYMSDVCNARIVAYEDYYDKDKVVFEKGKNVIIGGGARAGHSGDMDALLMAKVLNIKTIVSLKNVDAVYTADPKKDPSAKQLNKITWDEYFKIIGYKKTHQPGGNYPIDPITAADAKKSGVEFVIIDGSNLENFEKVLKGEKFAGTRVF